MMELYIGSHLSTAGGWNALLERSHEEGGTAFAFFPRSPYGKRSKALDPAGAAAFGARLKAEGYGPLVVHAPYVYNLAGKDEAKRAFAIEALAEDIELLTAIRAAGQEVYINIHPGAHVGQGAETGCRLISEGLNQVFERADGVMVLLETMAGKGTECGRNFEELATIMNGVENKANVGVTFDTCHVLDAGYDLENDYDGVMRQHRRRAARHPVLHATGQRSDHGQAPDDSRNQGADADHAPRRNRAAAWAGGLNHIGSSAPPPAATAPTGPPTNGDIVVMRTSYTTIPQYDFIVMTL